jgi:hypothetical protein
MMAVRDNDFVIQGRGRITTLLTDGRVAGPPQPNAVLGRAIVASDLQVARNQVFSCAEQPQADVAAALLSWYRLTQRLVERS